MEMAANDFPSNDDNGQDEVEKTTRQDEPKEPEPHQDKPSPQRALRFALTIGQHAIKYGSTGANVEESLTALVKEMGYDADFFALSTELAAATLIPQDEEDPLATLPTITMVKAPGGMSLYKLSLLSDVIKDVVKGKITIDEAVLEMLPDIESKKDPYPPLFECVFGYVFAGASLPVVLAGSGWDCFVGAIGSLLCWAVIMVSGRFSKFFGFWTMSLCAFLPAILATGMKIRYPIINVTIATLSAVAIPLPGFGISLGTAELVLKKILRGASDLIEGLRTLLLLVLGGWLGAMFVAACATIPPSPAPDPVPRVWQWLAIPGLALCLPVAFQVAPRDMFWAFVASGITYAVQFGTSYFASGNVAVFVSSAVATGYCNLWARLFDRPATIVMTPPIVFLVSGSIGFRGLASFLEGDTQLGGQRFPEMIVVALLIVVGLLVGNTVIQPKTTL